MIAGEGVIFIHLGVAVAVSSSVSESMSATAADIVTETNADVLLFFGSSCHSVMCCVLLLMPIPISLSNQ